MYIPSGFLYEIIRSEKIGVFCESNKNDNRALIAKLPSSTIKSISLGAKIEFYIAINQKDTHYLALCMKIFDSDSSPLFAILPQRWKSPNNRFNSSFLDVDLDFVMFDETDAPVQEGKVNIKTSFRTKRIKFILDNYKLISANDFNEVNLFMDSVCASLGLNYEEHSECSIQIFKCSTEVKNIKAILAIHANEQGITHYHIGNDIDGSRQERQIYQSLCLMRNSKTTLSPLVTIGKKERELTDILTTTANSVIAFESKSLEVNEYTISKSHERSASNIVKHSKKAINQLEGAYKTISRGDRVYDANNKALLLGGSYKFYGVVLIDEFRFSNEWDDVIKSLKNSSMALGICLNVISLSEMIYVLKLCNSDIDLFVDLLEKRHQACIVNGSIDISFTNGLLPII